jgi:uncharacterized phage protein (TIGR01671 family)
MKLIARIWDIDGGKMSAGIDLDLFMQNEVELQFPKTDESLPFKDFLYFRKEYSDWMPYARLKDRNRNDIFQDDILEVETKGKIFRGVVKWNVQSAGFIISNEKRYIEIISCAQFGLSHDYIVVDETEVIGNIYENPELLSQSPSPTQTDKQ